MARRATRADWSTGFRRAALLAAGDFVAGPATVTVANRVVRLVLLLAGVSVPEVARPAGAPASSLRSLAEGLGSLSGGEDAASLLADGRKRSGRRSPLGGEVGERLLEEVDRANFFDLGQVRRRLEEKPRVRACERTISGFLHAHGVRKLEAGSIPAKADPEAQASFWRDRVRPLLDEASREGSKTSVLFVDASHFVIGCEYLGSVWCSGRRFLRTFSGRQRHNVLGALDWSTKGITYVANDDYVNAETFVGLLEKVAEGYEGRDVTMVLDNARYQRCGLVSGRARELGIELLYLPPYSPNLNLIERVWRLVKSDLRKSRWEDFEGFSRRIDELVESTSGANRARVESLIRENVQLFDGYRGLFGDVVEAPPRGKGGRGQAA